MSGRPARRGGEGKQSQPRAGSEQWTSIKTLARKEPSRWPFCGLGHMKTPFQNSFRNCLPFLVIVLLSLPLGCRRGNQSVGASTTSTNSTSSASPAPEAATPTRRAPLTQRATPAATPVSSGSALEPYGVAAPAGYKWVVTFDDEFHEDALNTNLWNAGYSGGIQWCNHGNCPPNWTGISFQSGSLSLMPIIGGTGSYINTGGATAATAKLL